MEEISSAADLLYQLTAAGRIEDPAPYEATQSQISSARTLLSRVGVTAPATETAIQLELDENAPLALKVLAYRHRLESPQSEDAEHERRPFSADRDLAQFVTALERALAAAGMAEWGFRSA